MKRPFTLAMLCTLLVLVACEFDVPITAEPTRRVESTLLGDWTGTEWNDQDCKDQLKIRRYDDSSYVVSLNGALHRAWHSDVEGMPLVTVQNLDSPERKYSYYTWSLSDGGKQLTLRFVTDTLIPKEAKDSATVAKLLREHRDDGRLLSKPDVFTRKK
jgi:hypothetical protein